MAIRTYGENLLVNATSRKYVVEGGTNDSRLEPISLVLSGSFNSATCTLQVSAGDTSPMVFAAASSGAFTAAGGHNFELVPGMYFRFVNSSSGSPQANITYKVRGQIKIVA
jgi:hypothetical protein